MKKRIMASFVFALLLVSLSGCKVLSSLGLGGGPVEGEIGTKMTTEWFEFTVKSAEIVDSYADYTASEGYKLLEVVVTEKNISSDTLPMGTYDFLLDDPADAAYYVSALDPLDDKMMPLDFDLKPGETVTYHLLFEVDAASSGYKFLYTEYFTDESEGKTFIVDLGV